MSKVECYYCQCSQFILAISPPLESLPLRDLSKSVGKEVTECRVISRQIDKCVFTLDSNRDNDAIRLKGANGKNELWWVHRCPRCKLAIGYDLEQKGPRYTYIFKDSLQN